MLDAFNLSEIRHQLHQLAEPSGAEIKTQQFILQTLKALAPTKVITFDNSLNILAIYDFGADGETILFRGDFDAVRIDETIDVPYASQTQGVSHKCGHDGHATTLLGLASLLHTKPLPNGRILLFFQAAEETGEGAQKLLDTNILEQYTPDKVFALHNIPGEALGTVICKADSFTCSVVSCDIELHGRTSHAAEPLKAINPYAAARDIVDQLLTMNQYDMHRDDYCLVTLVEFRIGEQAYGVTAGHGVLRFTLRAQDDRVLQQTKKQLVQIVENIVAQTDGLSYQIGWKEYFAASKNQKDAVTIIQKAAEESGLKYTNKELPFSWGEDFGLLTQHFDGALFGLGSGINQPSLHHQHFDYPDDLLPIGAKLFYDIAVLVQK